MMTKCMMKKKKAMMDVKQQSEFLGVLTRSKTLALQRLQKESGEFGQLGSRRFKKVGGSASGEVKKRGRKGRGDGGILLKGGRRSGRKRKGEVVGGEERVGELIEGLEDLGKRGQVEKGEDDLVSGGVLDAIGGSNTALGFGFDGGIAENAGFGGGVVAAANGGAGSEGGEQGGGCFLGDNVLVTGGNDRVTRESTPEHLIIRSDYIRTPCSSTKGAKTVAVERPQIEVGGNSTQHKKLTTDLLLQDNSNYATSMEKYNFDFENEKPRPGRFEWEKIQP